MTPALAVALMAAFAQGPRENPVFRAGVSLVHVDAEALSREGRIVGGLGREDFRVYDNGRPQDIVHFAGGEEALDLILLFDISGSMSPVVVKVAAAARQGFAELKPGDRVSVMVFNSSSRMVAPFTDNLESVERSIREDVLKSKFGGATLIQQSVDDAALRFLGEPRTERRRAVLIVTDNMGRRTRRESGVVRDFWESDAILSGLIVASPAFQALRAATIVLAPEILLMEAGMTGIAQKTGGDVIRTHEPGPGFQEAMRRIRARYSIYYALPPGRPGERRKIRVELAPQASKLHPKATIRARTGYTAPATNVTAEK